MRHKTRLAILAILIALIAPFCCVKTNAAYYQNNGKHPRSIARQIKKHQKIEQKNKKQQKKQQKQQNKNSPVTSSPGYYYGQPKLV